MGEACRLWQQLAEAHPHDPRAQAALAIGLVSLARAHAIMGRVSEAEKAAHQAVKAAERIATDHPRQPVYREILAWVHWGPAEVHEHAGRPAEAVGPWRRRAASFEALTRE